MTDPQQAEPNVDLDELERLHEAATPGDWQGNEVTAGKHKGSFVEADSEGVILDCYGPRGGANADLIAAMRNALPQLIALARSASEAKARLDLLESAVRYRSGEEPQEYLRVALVDGWTGKAGT